MSNQQALRRVIADYQRIIDDYGVTIKLLAEERARIDAMYKEIGEQVAMLNAALAYADDTMRAIAAEDEAGEGWKDGNANL